MTVRDTLTLSASEVRFATDDAGTFSDYAATWDEPTAYGESVAKGAFRLTLREHQARKTRPAMFWSHDSAQVIGVWDELIEDDRALKVRV